MLSITRIQEVQSYGPPSGQENCQSSRDNLPHRKQLPSMISALERNHVAWSGQTRGSHPKSAGILTCELKCNSFHFCQLIAHQKMRGDCGSLNPTAHSSTQSIRTNASPSSSSINAFKTQPSVFSIPNPECSNSWKKITETDQSAHVRLPNSRDPYHSASLWNAYPSMTLFRVP